MALLWRKSKHNRLLTSHVLGWIRVALKRVKRQSNSIKCYDDVKSPDELKVESLCSPVLCYSSRSDLGSCTALKRSVFLVLKDLPNDICCLV